MKDCIRFAPMIGAREGELPRDEGPGVFGWLARHRAAATATLVPVLAALALIVYVRIEGGREPIAMLELSSEGEATTVIQTADGPVVLLEEEHHRTVGGLQDRRRLALRGELEHRDRFPSAFDPNVHDDNEGRQNADERRGCRGAVPRE